LSALRIGLLVLDGTTLAEVIPVRERLEALGAQVTLVIPGGGSILPVTGRYFPAAGGQGTRRALNQVSPTDFDLLLLPDSVSIEQLLRKPAVLEFMRGHAETAEMPPAPVFHIHYLLRLLDGGSSLAGLEHPKEGILSGLTRGR